MLVWDWNGGKLWNICTLGSLWNSVHTQVLGGFHTTTRTEGQMATWRSVGCHWRSDWSLSCSVWGTFPVVNPLGQPQSPSLGQRTFAVHSWEGRFPEILWLGWLHQIKQWGAQPEPFSRISPVLIWALKVRFLHYGFKHILGPCCPRHD